MVWIERVRSETIRHDFVAWTFALTAQFGSFCTEFSAVAKRCHLHPNIMKRTKTWIYGPMVWIRRVRSDKFERDFLTFALIVKDWPICIEFSAVTKWSQMHQTLRNATKYEFRVPWCVSRAFLAKSSDASSCHEHFASIVPIRPILHQV